MKKLTYSSMAAARLRANKRQYLSLVLGIFLSIFLISTLVLCIYDIYQAQLQKRYDTIGYLDMVILDNDDMDIVTEEAVLETGDYDRLGYAYLSGVVTGKNVYVGYYDAVGTKLLNLSALEGRLPENPGEIALEQSAMDVLDVAWAVGETVELAITPIDGVEENRQYTLVGILPERSVYLERIDYNNIGQFPAIITSTQEKPFDTGRVAYHMVLGFGKNGSISNSLKGFWGRFQGYDAVLAIYGLSITGEQVHWFGTGDFINSNQEMFTLILMACVLAGSLILSCGIGISGAMEGVLSKRREEIGVLRALGATRRQIRRMFGRENLILAAVASPLSIFISVGTVWVLSLLMPESLKFAVNLWLIIPIALFSVVVILISGYLPLVRASKLMPMSVIRDTAMLRRSKGMKSKKEFSATRLIAARQVRFHPTRQIGSMFLVGLMLLCSGLVGTLVYSYRSYTRLESPGFSIDRSFGYSSKQGVVCYAREPMSQQSIRQLKSLDHVKFIRINREMDIIAQVDTVPRYAVIFDHAEQYGMLDDRLICILLAVLLVLSLRVTAFAAEFEIDQYATIDSMSRSWYQGYEPTTSYHTMTLCLPIRTESCVGDITVSIALDDPNVFLLTSEPRTVTVSPKDGIYPVELSLALERYRRNGDFPVTITIKGTGEADREIVENIPYVIRIRDGYDSHETMSPVITDVVSDLNVGCDGSLSLTITNPTTQSILDGEITVTDTSGEILMSGSNRMHVNEILPGKSETVTIPMAVKSNASISQHTLEVIFSYNVLDRDTEWKESFTVPVTQAIRLEQGGVQLPAAIAGELSNMTLPLMNMGKGELQNVLVKLEVDGVLDAQSVLVGTIAAGETRQAKLTYTPKLDSVGTHSGTVNITCEDAYGNTFSQTLDVTLTVDEPIPEAETQQAEEKEKINAGTIILIGVCIAMAAGFVVQGVILTEKIHKLEEERL